MAQVVGHNSSDGISIFVFPGISDRSALLEKKREGCLYAAGARSAPWAPG